MEPDSSEHTVRQLQQENVSQGYRLFKDEPNNRTAADYFSLLCPVFSYVVKKRKLFSFFGGVAELSVKIKI